MKNNRNLEYEKTFFVKDINIDDSTLFFEIS